MSQSNKHSDLPFMDSHWRHVSGHWHCRANPLFHLLRRLKAEDQDERAGD